MIEESKLEIFKRNMQERGVVVKTISSPPKWDDPLEQLFEEAQRAAKPSRTARVKDPAKPNALPSSTQSVHLLFTLPENWLRVGGVALVHKETQSLLGNFSEYRHVSVHHATKLVREETPISVQRTETVSGSWWLGADRLVVPHSVWHETRRALVKLFLPDLGVFTPLAEVAVQISHGGIARVELIEETLFSDSDGKQLLTLPAGLNILPVLGLECRINLKSEVGL